MGARADGARLARPLFQAGDGGSRPTSALHLWLDRVTLNVARPLNQLWHSTLPRYGRGFIKNQSDLCYAAEHEGRYYAVAILSNPVARNLPQDTWLELRRLAVAPDAPRNTASRILRIVALLVRRDRSAITQSAFTPGRYTARPAGRPRSSGAGRNGPAEAVRGLGHSARRTSSDGRSPWRTEPPRRRPPGGRESENVSPYQTPRRAYRHRREHHRRGHRRVPRTGAPRRDRSP
jgi:hypothetical protein